MGHIIATMDEVREITAAQENFWLSNCGCREGAGAKCAKGLRVCLGFVKEATSSPHERGPIDRKEMEKLLEFAKSEKLIPRPYLDDSGKMNAVCFCCPCCCSYMRGEYPNVAGKEVETTEITACTACGACASVCYFGARKIVDGVLKIDRAGCYGCGLCAGDCPSGAIRMVPR